jgi:hypothetical protein
MSANFAQLLADIEKETRADRYRKERCRESRRDRVACLTAACPGGHGAPRRDPRRGRKANTNICSGNRTGNKLSKTEEHRETENPMNPGLIT